jgi:hypothetical protein
MFGAVLWSQWRESRLGVLMLAGFAFIVPVLCLWGKGSESDPWAHGDLMRVVWQWGVAYPSIALAAALAIGVGVWRPDHRGLHVYALSLPVARSRYLLMRYGAGLLFLTGIAVALWVGGASATARVPLPPTLHAYPGGLALRFWLAGLMAYTMMFALSGLTERAARILVAGLLLLVIVTFSANAMGAHWNPLGWSVDALFGPYGPLGVFRIRWMLIDV